MSEEVQVATEVPTTEEISEVPQPETPEATVEEAPAKPAETPNWEERLKAAEREIDRHKRRADYAMREMDAHFKQAQAQPPAVQPPADVEPNPETFGENTLDYAKAWSAWNARQTVKQEQEKLREDQAKKEAEAKTQEYVKERVGRLEKECQDQEVNAACDTLGMMGVRIGTTLQDALHESENFAGLAKHLAANPQEVQRLQSLSPAKQARELTKMEATLATKAPTPPPLKQTNAPPPPKPLEGASSGPAVIDLNDPKLPIDVWIRENNRRMLAAGKIPPTR